MSTKEMIFSKEYGTKKREKQNCESDFYIISVKDKIQKSSSSDINTIGCSKGKIEEELKEIHKVFLENPPDYLNKGNYFIQKIRTSISSKDKREFSGSEMEIEKLTRENKKQLKNKGFSNSFEVRNRILKVFDETTKQNYWKRLDEISQITGYSIRAVEKAISTDKPKSFFAPSRFVRNSENKYSTRKAYEKNASFFNKLMDAFELKIT